MITLRAVKDFYDKFESINEEIINNLILPEDERLFGRVLNG